VIDRSGSQSVALAGLIALAVALIAEPAFACGVSGADGAWSCSLAEHEEAERPRWSVGAVGLSTWTELKFDDLHAKEQRNAIVATAAYAPTRRLTVQLSAGAAFAGELRAPNGTHEFSVGPTGAAGVVYTLLEGRPFVALSGVVSASHATTQLRGSGPSVNYDAFDLRLGVIAGTTVFEMLSPYIVARAFGGPVFWHYGRRAQTGTDIAHYQLGVGLALRPIETLAVFAEGVPLGERGVSAGASIAF
jgi:hypothetical protein